MSKLITLDEAIEWGKRGELCDLVTEDDQRQIAEWLRRARGAESAARWYTAKLRDVEAENAKLRVVLDECALLLSGHHLPELREEVFEAMREFGIEVEW